MSHPTTCADTPSATSLPALADGPTPWTLPDGRVIDPCGLAAALASLSARQVKALGLQTSGISGRRGITSSASAYLQSFMENRLRERLNGSISCAVIWRRWITPWNAALSQPALLGRNKSEVGSGLWPTPSKTDSTGRGYHRSNGKVFLALPGALMVSLGLPHQCPQTRRITGMFYCSLMGYPAIWHQSRPMETPSSRKSRSSSLKPTAKPEA